MRPPIIPLSDLETLPIVYSATIPERYRDMMGHMNIRWYLELFDEAGMPLFDLIGLTAEHYAANGAGGFDLEHHVHYLNEVHIGDTIEVRGRLLARSAKRLHYMLFMINTARGKLAATFECVNSYADLRIRRTAPYPAEIAERIDVLLSAHQKLPWAAPVCGSMGA
jgi:acyl-CoA thioester hydrolase